MKKYYLLCLMLFAACTNRGFAQTISSQKGLTTAVFNLPAGIIKVYLPDDIRPGEMISGTIIAEAGGRNAKEVTKNLSDLKKYTVAFNAQKLAVSEAGKSFQCNISKAVQPKLLLNLIGGNGENAGFVNIEPAKKTKTASAPAECKIPTHALTAAPLRITGPFDGNSSNTNCNVDGKPIEILAESPRQCVVSFPENAKGDRTIEVQENKQPACSKKISGVELNVTAGKTNLVKGEQTYFNVKLSGLRGLSDMALLRLDNITANTVTMQPANNLIVPLNPDSVGDGNYNGHFNIQSINNGSFTINVNLDLPDAAKDIYTDLPKTNSDTKTDTVPCKGQEEKVKAAEEALQKLNVEFAGIASGITKLKYALLDCKEALKNALDDYNEKEKAFKILETLKKQRDLNSGRYSQKQREQNDKEYENARDAKDAALQKKRDQKHACDALEAKIAEQMAREKALPGEIKKAEDEIGKTKDELEKCKTKAAEDKKKKDEEEKRNAETQPEPADGNINPGTGAGKEGSPCNPEGVELVEPVKRVYGSCFVKETEISPCNTDRISNEVLEAIKKAFEKFKNLKGPLEIAQKVASCASSSKAICVNVHVVRNWEDAELTYMCVNGKWVLKNRKVTGMGQDDYGWYIVKDKEVGNLCCWVFGKKADAEDAMEAHLKDAIQDILKWCK